LRLVITQQVPKFTIAISSKKHYNPDSQGIRSHEATAFVYWTIIEFRADKETVYETIWEMLAKPNFYENKLF
jgi:hypothetical protein